LSRAISAGGKAEEITDTGNKFKGSVEIPREAGPSPGGCSGREARPGVQLCAVS
jgi:hypothetical protein